MTSPYGNNLHHSENVTHGEFAFTTKESGNYIACFWADAKSHGNKDVSINVEWKTGIATKDWASIAKREKLEVSFHTYFILYYTCTCSCFFKTFEICCLFNVGSGAGD